MQLSPLKSLHSEAWQAVFLPNLLLVFGFIINFDSLTIIYLWMRQVQQCQSFRMFQQKVPSVFSNISLGQFGPKTGSRRIAYAKYIVLLEMGPLRAAGEVWKGGLQGRTSPYPLSRSVPPPPPGVLQMYMVCTQQRQFTNESSQAPTWFIYIMLKTLL